jgi:hypothetical protein
LALSVYHSVTSLSFEVCQFSLLLWLMSDIASAGRSLLVALCACVEEKLAKNGVKYGVAWNRIKYNTF